MLLMQMNAMLMYNCFVVSDFDSYSLLEINVSMTIVVVMDAQDCDDCVRTMMMMMMMMMYGRVMISSIALPFVPIIDTFVFPIMVHSVESKMSPSISTPSHERIIHYL